MPKGMELDVRQVRAFAAVVEYAHFGRAARSLFLTQQALSKRIARLESQVGTLFDRASSGPTLTPRGRRFLPAARRLLDEAEATSAWMYGDRSIPPSRCFAPTQRSTPRW